MNNELASIKSEILVAAKILWKFMKLESSLAPTDLIFVLGSRDDRVAVYAAELYNHGLAKQF